VIERDLGPVGHTAFLALKKWTYCINDEQLHEDPSPLHNQADQSKQLGLSTRSSPIQVKGALFQSVSSK
jgi:hypothetical protein